MGKRAKVTVAACGFFLAGFFLMPEGVWWREMVSAMGHAIGGVLMVYSRHVGGG